MASLLTSSVLFMIAAYITSYSTLSRPKVDSCVGTNVKVTQEMVNDSNRPKAVLGSGLTVFTYTIESVS